MVFTEDFFADIKPYVPEWYDASVYEKKKPTDKDHLAVKECGFPVGLNKKKPGLMADDCANDFITEFWGLASKEYCYKTEKGKVEIKAKGIGKNMRKKVLSWKDCDEAVKKGKPKEVEQRQIRSFGLKNHTIKMKKTIFTGDKKRILLPDGINLMVIGGI